ncbi:MULTISPECIES: sensor histidine kinase [unclassified Nocardia]|uniref:sensor histidine kinase n=1 Tax=unclassified Nocardia TaxID=2637762 RepID=UPI001CE4A55D|nr:MULTISPECIES: sensor histidine kinase [unclassified Nocardia]
MDEYDAHLLAEIADSTSVSMWAAAGPEADYAIKLWTRGAERLYGYSGEEAIGESYITLLINSLEHNRAIADHNNIVRTGIKIRTLVNDVIYSGSQRLLLTVRFPLYDKRTNTHLLAETAIDVTDVSLEDAAQITRTREEAIHISESAAREDLSEQLRRLVGALTLSGTGEDERAALALGVELLRRAMNAPAESSVWLVGRSEQFSEAFRSSGWMVPPGLDIGRALDWFRSNPKPILHDSKSRPHRLLKQLFDTHQGPVDTVAMIPLHAEGEFVGLHLMRVPAPHAFTQLERDALPVLSSAVLASARLAAEVRRRREEAAESRAEATRLRLNGDFAHRIRKAVDPILRDVHAIREELDLRGVKLDGELAQWIDDITDGCTELARAPEELHRAQMVARISIRGVLTALRNRLGLEFPDSTVELDIDGIAGVLVRGVKGDITALFENLLYNAIEAMGNRGRVLVSGAVSGRSVSVVVSDEGPGIKPEDVAGIFQLGFSKKGKGRGLGLARAKEIVTDLGGQITVDVQRSPGATFVIILPICREGVDGDNIVARGQY